jgi:NAD(P)-dependent dehydrogenase (short-subunit alcohol dehydrogenase family)
VIITARSNAKGVAAKEAIEAQTGTRGKDIVKVMELDMSTFVATKAFADAVKREVTRIDYVLLNSGVFNKAFHIGEEGFEHTMQVNVLATALLALLLLPWMKEAGDRKAHLGFVTSGTHRGVSIEGTWPQEDVLGFFSKEDNWPKNMYAVSKLLEQYVANEIAKLALGPDGRCVEITTLNTLNGHADGNSLARKSSSNPMCPGTSSCHSSMSAI